MNFRNSVKSAALITAIIGVFFLLQSCSSTSEPEAESLGSFDIVAPDTVTAGLPFSITVTAVGNQGSVPFTSFDGSVSLSVSGGSISPWSIDLADGAGTFEIVLSGDGGAQTLTASSGNASGSVLLNAGLLDAIPGDPADLVAGAIPGFDYVAAEDNFSDGHPDLGDSRLSHNIAIVVFEPGTTIAAANSVLSGLTASIVGGITGVNGQAPGILFLRLPATTHAEMESALSSLRGEGSVALAIQDMLVGGQEIPGVNAGIASWRWESVPAGGNWGLERCRVPQMWNLNDAIRKSGRAVMTGIIDVGFYPGHEDLMFYNLDPGDHHDHGIMVAGVLGATYNNNKGIDGVNPFAGMIAKPLPNLSGATVATSMMSCGQGFISNMYSFCRSYSTVKVLNMSLGYNWSLAGIDGSSSGMAASIAYAHGALVKYTLDLLSIYRPLPIICVSAGNDSGRGFGWQSARNNSPMTNAAIEHGVENILVVEAVQDSPGTGTGDATLWEHSSIGGHISAPGADILTSIVGYYSTGSGTSLSSPFVAGLVGYLLCVDPSLTLSEIKGLLAANSLSVGSGGAGRADAWASAVDIDRIRGNDDVLTMLCDIDDGTEDGNQRVDLDTGDDYTDDDADGDGGAGDGRVDMSDFRRWRDWMAQIDGHELNGSGEHDKKDINGDGIVGTAAEENVYPRGDFNGDGKLHATDPAPVPGSIGTEATDLEVFKTVFDDDDYEAVDLDELVHSFDLEIDATRFFSSSAPPPAVTVVLRAAGSGTIVEEREYTASDPAFLATVPYIGPGYDITLELSTTGLNQDPDDVTLAIGIGDDLKIEMVASIVIDPKATYLHTCEDMANSATPILLAGLGIEPGDILLLESSGNIVMGQLFYGDRMGAVFSSSDVLLGGSESHRVPGAISVGSTWVSDVTSRCGGETTDIPEDFTVNDVAVVTVPAGARYLFAAKHDSWYQDNYDDNGDWRFVISIIRTGD